MHPNGKPWQIFLPHGQRVLFHVRSKAGIYCCHFVRIGNGGECTAYQDYCFEMLRAHDSADAVALGLMGPTAHDACIADEVLTGGTDCRDVGGPIVLLGDGISGRSDSFAPQRRCIDDTRHAVFDDEADGTL